MTDKEVVLQKYPEAVISEYGPVNGYPKQYSIWKRTNPKSSDERLSGHSFRVAGAWSSAAQKIKRQ